MGSGMWGLGSGAKGLRTGTWGLGSGLPLPSSYSDTESCLLASWLGYEAGGLVELALWPLGGICCHQNRIFWPRPHRLWFWDWGFWSWGLVFGVCGLVVSGVLAWCLGSVVWDPRSGVLGLVSRFGVWCQGSGVWGPGFWVWGKGWWGLGPRVWGLVCGLWFGVWGLGVSAVWRLAFGILRRGLDPGPGSVV